MKYKDKAKIAGKIYPLNTSFRVGTECMNICNDPDISDEERALAIIYKLFGFIPDDHLDDFLRIASNFLSCGEKPEEHSAKKPDMDFVQDEKYISASFQSDYRIDLSKEDMHWFRYCELIAGLTEHSVLSRVREIRNYDLRELKDPKQRQKMADAQQAVALKHIISREEQEAIDKFESLF